MEFGQAGVRRDRGNAILGANGRIERTILVRRPVVIPERDKRPQFDLYTCAAIGSAARRVDIVFDYSRVLAVNHEQALFDFDTFNVIDEGRERIEPEFLEIAMSLRMYRAGILVGREIVRVA